MAATISALLHLSQVSQLATILNEKDPNNLVRSGILLKTIMPGLKYKSDLLKQQLSELSGLQMRVDQQKKALGPILAEVTQKQAILSQLFEAKSMALSTRSKIDFDETVLASSSLQELLTRVRKNKKLARLIRQQIKELELQPPVQGKLLSAFDQEKQFSIYGSGAVIETRMNAQVVAPSGGTIIFAGPFQDYGNTLIISAGSHYHVLLAGLEVITVAVGQEVLPGEPVGHMASQGKLPKLYLELRKNTQTINPTPWVIKWNQ